MARTPSAEGAIRMRRVKATIGISDDTAKQIASAVFGKGSPFTITGGTLFVEHMIPADAADLVERTADAEKQMCEAGTLRTLSSSYTRVASEDAPATGADEEIELVEKEGAA